MRLHVNSALSIQIFHTKSIIYLSLKIETRILSVKIVIPRSRECYYFVRAGRRKIKLGSQFLLNLAVKCRSLAQISFVKMISDTDFD